MTSKDLEKTELSTSLDKTTSDKNEKRRSLLKKLAVGGIAGAAMPTKWSKPVVDAVVLPAHAQTSDSSVLGGGGGSGSAGPGPVPNNSIGEEILDLFTTPAHADYGVRPYCIEIRIDQENNVITKVTALKLCYQECNSPEFDGKPKNISATELTGSGSDWSGVVDGRDLILTNVDPNASVLADSNYHGVDGEIINGGSCNCCTLPS